MPGSSGNEVVGTVFNAIGSGFQLVAPYAGYIGIGSCALMVVLLMFASGGGSAPEKAKPAPSAE